ncbi:MAG: hypothetical protein AAF943_17190 [Pseudomonadota bacterium]
MNNVSEDLQKEIDAIQGEFSDEEREEVAQKLSDIAQKHRVILQALLSELGQLSEDELNHMRAAQYGVKDLLDDAGMAWGIYQDWHGAHWPDGGVGRLNDGGGFSVRVKEWRKGERDDDLLFWPTVGHFWAASRKDISRKGSIRANAQKPRPNATGRPPTLKVKPAPKAVAFTEHEALLRAEVNAFVRAFRDEVQREVWIANKAKQLIETSPEQIVGREMNALFLYWAFEATSRFYERFLPDRDRKFRAPRERDDIDCTTVVDELDDKFSEAARFAFTLANGFEPDFAPKHCRDIIDLWNYEGTNAAKLKRREQREDRLLSMGELFRPS